MVIHKPDFEDSGTGARLNAARPADGPRGGAFHLDPARRAAPFPTEGGFSIEEYLEGDADLPAEDRREEAEEQSVEVSDDVSGLA